jgi:hypothetical protein
MLCTLCWAATFAWADEELTIQDESEAAAADAADDPPPPPPPSDDPPPDFDYADMMRNMGGGMGGMGGGMDNPYMEKMRRENPELFANMGDMGNFYGGGGGARVIPDCRFRKTDTESVRKFGGIEWLSCTTK